jgi:hypothetical protein
MSGGFDPKPHAKPAPHLVDAAPKSLNMLNLSNSI